MPERESCRWRARHVPEKRCRRLGMTRSDGRLFSTCLREQMPMMPPLTLCSCMIARRARPPLSIFLPSLHQLISRDEKVVEPCAQRRLPIPVTCVPAAASGSRVQGKLDIMRRYVDICVPAFPRALATFICLGPSVYSSLTNFRVENCRVAFLVVPAPGIYLIVSLMMGVLTRVLDPGNGKPISASHFGSSGFPPDS